MAFFIYYFEPRGYPDSQILLVFHILTVMIFISCFWINSNFFNGWQKKKDILKFHRDRNSMMIGFVSIFLMSVIGKVYSFYIGIRFSDSISPLFLLSLIIAFYIGFAAKFDKKYRLGMVKHKTDFITTILFILFFNALFLYHTIEKAQKIEGDIREVVLVWQVVFSIFGAASSVDMYFYAKGKVYDEDEEVSLESVKVVAKEPEPTAEDTVRKPVEPKETTEPTIVILITEGLDSEDSDSEEEDSAEEDTIPYCDACYDDYSNSRIPRILTKCGHTICEECAKGLLRGNGMRCPYCKKITLVNGPANSLRKNFALMDIVEREMKKYYVE
ncbi:hypothetical protein CRE_29049 [Caenorhabditis remanei]|uniref:RING-type domain-containing protein n=1 Tax=Caenorhabditis remanei TaxID=31234 RepID=E3MW88_CAERE|nr:hypothetical protein CRE_29049 [Caenorhabditis remanei]